MLVLLPVFAAGTGFFKPMEVSRHKKPATVVGYVRESNLFGNHAGVKFYNMR